MIRRDGSEDEINPQWDADQERPSEDVHEALVVATRVFLKQWDVVLPAIIGAFTMQQVHGARYTGPSLEAELAQLKAALARAESEPRADRLDDFNRVRR